VYSFSGNFDGYKADGRYTINEFVPFFVFVAILLHAKTAINGQYIFGLNDIWCYGWFKISED